MVFPGLEQEVLWGRALRKLIPRKGLVNRQICASLSNTPQPSRAAPAAGLTDTQAAADSFPVLWVPETTRPMDTTLSEKTRQAKIGTYKAVGPFIGIAKVSPIL